MTMLSRPDFAAARLFFLVLTALFLTQPAFSTALQLLSMDQIAADSTEIVQGTVTGSHVAMSGSTIFTHYTVHVTNRLKGPENPTVDVAIPGGALNGLRQTYPGVPLLSSGREYLFFLWQGSKGPNQLVGLNQGLFEIGAGEQGEMMASREGVGEMMMGPGGQPVADHPMRLKLSDLRAGVRAAVAKGRAE